MIHPRNSYIRHTNCHQQDIYRISYSGINQGLGKIMKCQRFLTDDYADFPFKFCKSLADSPSLGLIFYYLPAHNQGILTEEITAFVNDCSNIGVASATPITSSPSIIEQNPALASPLLKSSPLSTKLPAILPLSLLTSAA